MPIGEKFQLMEALWEDMRERFESMPVSDEIKALLDERRARAARGESKILDLRRDPQWIAERLGA